jgi:hypothetical protein
VGCGHHCCGLLGCDHNHCGLWSPILNVFFLQKDCLWVIAGALSKFCYSILKRVKRSPYSEICIFGQCT